MSIRSNKDYEKYNEKRQLTKDKLRESKQNYWKNFGKEMKQAFVTN